MQWPACHGKEGLSSAETSLTAGGTAPLTTAHCQGCSCKHIVSAPDPPPSKTKTSEVLYAVKILFIGMALTMLLPGAEGEGADNTEEAEEPAEECLEAEPSTPTLYASAIAHAVLTRCFCGVQVTARLACSLGDGPAQA